MRQQVPDIYEYTGGTTALTVFHGSKNGISGPILPTSRKITDFGEGFYMGTDPEQPKMLVSSWKRPVFYEMRLNLSSLKCVNINGLPWAMLVAYNRGKLEHIKNTKLYSRMTNITLLHDVIKGPIADDRMYRVLDYFFDNVITDRTLIACIQGLDLGQQYVAKTNRACDPKHIEITTSRTLRQDELDDLQLQATENRKRGYQLVNQYRAQERAAIRKKQDIGRYFEDILEEESDGDNRNEPGFDSARHL